MTDSLASKYQHWGEGAATVLMKNGKVLNDKLSEESLTLQELQAAAHRQGFAELSDVETAVLEKSGTMTFIARKPSPEQTRHEELLDRLDRLTREVAELHSKVSPRE